MIDWLKRNWGPFVIVHVYLVGIIGFLIPSIQSAWVQLTPVNLLFGLLMLLIFHQPKQKNFWLSLGIIGALGFLFEVIGVQTGVLFGTYTYGNILGVKILGTPLMLAVNWILLIYLTNYIARKISSKNGVIALIGGLLMVGIDVLIEPFAIHFNLWTWEAVHVPIQNYVMWFILSFGFHLIFNYFNKQLRNEISVCLFGALVVFFLVIDLMVIW